MTYIVTIIGKYSFDSLVPYLKLVSENSLRVISLGTNIIYHIFVINVSLYLLERPFIHSNGHIGVIMLTT